jgi:hypothetical protein
MMGMTVGLGFASARDKVALPGGGTISAVAGLRSVLLLIHDRNDLVPQITLELDETVAEESKPALHLVGDAGHDVVILEDTYASRPGGLSYCQAGKESFLRVLGLKRSGRETLRVKLSSCIANLELDDAGVVWKADTRSLQIHWTAAYAEYQIGSDGEARLTKPSR